MERQPANATQQNPASTDKRRIRFDGTGVKNSYANTCHVASTKEEIILNFGLNQSWDQGQQDIQVQLTNRIILSPFAAKRLAMLLRGVMHQYEARFGKLDVGPQSEPAPKADAADEKPQVVN
ncbi:MAG: DUF3467 domain-containing protein [Nitrospira sp.]|nr:DUF3467 domain-containing protein [Nitrospira sp.]